MVPQARSTLQIYSSIRPTPFTWLWHVLDYQSPSITAACKLATISVIQSLITRNLKTWSPLHRYTECTYAGGRGGPIVLSVVESAQCEHYKQTQSNAHFHSSRVIYSMTNSCTSNGSNISKSTCQVKGLVVALDACLGRKLEELMTCSGFTWRLLVCWNVYVSKYTRKSTVVVDWKCWSVIQST